MKMHGSFCCLLLAACILAGIVAAEEHLVVVNITTESIQTQIAVQACVGLFNRDTSKAGAAYTLLHEPVDSAWLADTDGVKNPVITSVSDFLHTCLAGPDRVAAGYLRFNYTAQQIVAPMLFTLSGVLDAIPLEDGSPHTHDAPLVFDALVEFAAGTPLSVTEYVFQHHVNVTSTLAFMDPGYTNVQKDPFAPVFKANLDPSLIDFIVKERVFNFYMVEACVPLTAEHALMERMVQNNPWPKPIAVFGYDNTMDVAGTPLYEAETTCVKEHNLGEACNAGVSNMAFFSRAARPPITTPMKQNPSPPEVLNRSRVYIGLTVGDGDNMQYLQTTRREWMLQRLARCKADPSYRGCFPLLWTISPFPLRIAPDWIRWYYDRAHETGQDFFVMPPSGHLYAYASEMPEEVQAEFIQATERDAQLLSTNAAVAWEFMGTWANAIENYFPKYDANAIMEGFFAVNVPYMVPVLEFNETEFYKQLGPKQRVILFRPREWRGTNPSGQPPFSGREYLTAEQMAAELNAYPPGTVSQIYLTSDGGANLSDYYDLVALLDEHVRVVDHRTLVYMAQNM